MTMKTLKHRILALLLGVSIPFLAWAGLETGDFIDDLVITNPLSSDLASTGDDHIRLIKKTVKASFPNIDGAVSATDEELSFVDGVTSAIQTQLDGKAGLTASNTFSSSFPQATFTSAAAGYVLLETGATADNLRWDVLADSEGLLYRAVNDANTVATAWLGVARTGTTVDSINLAATAVQTNGVDITATTGTFTLTLSTGCTTTPSVTARYAKTGNIVVLNWPAFTVCTSNSANTVLTGLPAALTPAANQAGPNCLSSDNGGTAAVSYCEVASTQVAISNGPSPGNSFTTSGTKTVYASTFSYLLN